MGDKHNHKCSYRTETKEDWIHIDRRTLEGEAKRFKDADFEDWKEEETNLEMAKTTES